MDAFICDYIRTPFGRYGGVLSGVRADDLAARPIRELVNRNPQLDWSLLDDVILGCVNQAGEDNRNVARMALLLAGLPETVPGATINRLCSSGLNAVSIAAHAIKAGEADLMIAGGIESMSRAPFVFNKSAKPFGREVEVYDTTIGWRFVNPLFKRKFGMEAMPETAENVAEQYCVSRQDQDSFAVRSQEKTARAIEAGRLAKEIVPVSIPVRKGEPIIVNADEHPRPGTTLEALAKLPAPFRENGTVTAGNASGVNDGAAALLIASESAVKAHGLSPLARIVGAAYSGVAPRIMGIGPVAATQKLCRQYHLSINDFDVIEINEAFASQALASLRELGVSDEADWVNPNGGAIAIGHPLGASGARLVGSAALELKETGKKRALATMCVGVGQGAALALEFA